MRGRFTPLTATTLASLAALSLLAACSETSPTSLRASESAAFTIGPTSNVGPVQFSFVSNGSTQFCTSAPGVFSNPVPTSLGPLSGCGTASDLENSLLTSYNPGWSQPSNGADWIGPTTTSNEYKLAPGSYTFQTQFSIPAGATSPVLNDTLLSDNAIAVYLNGHPVQAQAIQDCVSSPCNWNQAYVISDANAADFNIGGTNSITVLLVDTPNGATVGNYTCTKLPQDHGWTGFTFDAAHQVATAPNHVYSGFTSSTTLAQYAAAGCLNPGGVAFWGTVSYANPVITTWCSPGFWKNHESLWTQYLNVAYSSIGSFRAPLKAGSPSNPTLQQVVESPQVFGGPATNSVADYLSNKFFGTPIGSGVESCPDPSSFQSVGN